VVDRRESEIARPADPPSPEDVASGGEVTRAVTQAIARLSGAERHALILAAYGFQGSEIAFSIERTPGATRTLLCRARAKMREHMRVAGMAPA